MIKWYVELKDSVTSSLVSEGFDTRQDAEVRMRYYEHLDTVSGIYEPNAYKVVCVDYGKDKGAW